MLNITINKCTAPKQKPEAGKLGFGRYFSDHMFVMDYNEGVGWHDARIVPYGEISLEPSAMVFHYAQELFEGLKAYRTSNGEVQLFRPLKNIERMNNTCDRLCVPRIDPEDALQAIKAVVKTDEDWVPSEEGTSLYIRPFIIATDPFLGVHPSHSYKFIIILSPVGSYYAAGINPVKIMVEHEYVRCVKGGTGMAKIGGNYAASMLGQKKAEDAGYAQVLWLDGIHRRYIDEVGAMNVFFVINGTVITPELTDGNILPGVTRDSCIQLLKKWGMTVQERKVSIDELIEAYQLGTLEEAFGTGTAAVISPIGVLSNKGNEMIINGGNIGPISHKLYNAITGIQWGRVSDDMNWIIKID